MGKIYAAKTNHITNPIGFNMDTIAFSWKVKGCRGQEQKHARIVISKNKTFTDICYDTGETELDSLSTRVEFEIQPYTRYYWKVIVATDVEEVIESDVQFFETAKMDEPWTGRWITCDSSQERHPIFSKRIRPESTDPGTCTSHNVSFPASASSHRPFNMLFLIKYTFSCKNPIFMQSHI